MRAIAPILAALALGGCSADRTATTAERTSGMDERAALLAAPTATARPVSPRTPVAVLIDRALKSRIVTAAPDRDGTRALTEVRAGASTRGWIDMATAPDATRLARISAPFTERSVRAEIREGFPSSAMQVSGEPRYNRYGRYALATGTDGAGSNCVYAWQWIDGHADLPGAASIRARLCSPSLTPEELAARLDRIEVRPASRLLAVGPPRIRRSRVAAVLRRSSVAARPAIAETGARASQPVVRDDRVAPLEPSLRTAPELNLPVQAIRGPASAVRPSQTSPGGPG